MASSQETRRKPAGKFLTVHDASANNLKNLTVSFPLGLLIVITGVSGSGKSTLVNDIVYRALAQKLYGSKEEPGTHGRLEGAEQVDKVISIDQTPIGRTPRSNPATYTGVFTPLRELYSMLPESRERGYRPGRFSFNVKGGRCEACQGNGEIAVEMHFLPTVYVTCDVCQGKRFDKETLKVLAERVVGSLRSLDVAALAEATTIGVLVPETGEPEADIVLPRLQSQIDDFGLKTRAGRAVKQEWKKRSWHERPKDDDEPLLWFQQQLQ